MMSGYEIHGQVSDGKLFRDVDFFPDEEVSLVFLFDKLVCHLVVILYGLKT